MITCITEIKEENKIVSQGILVNMQKRKFVIGFRKKEHSQWRIRIMAHPNEGKDGRNKSTALLDNCLLVSIILKYYLNIKVH